MSRTKPRLAAAAKLAGALALVLAPAAARAQPGPSISDVEKVSESATVESVDPATRHLVIKRPSGETISLKVPAEVRNFENLKPGDTITANYYRETVISLDRGSTPPNDSGTTFVARNPQGGLPGGVVANRIVVTGAVLGVDTDKHILKVVSPQGGQVHEILVTDPRARALMRQLKPGDKITAQVNESLLIAANRQ